MRVCHYCKQDIHDAVSCNAPAVYQSGGPSYERIPYSLESHAEEDGSNRCANCFVVRGMLHHPGCLAEECPVCHRRLATCRCPLIFRHGESPRNGRAASHKAVPPNCPRPSSSALVLPKWHPTAEQRESAIAAVRFGRLSGCWKQFRCRITITDGVVLHEHDGLCETIPLGEDGEVIAWLRAQHSGRDFRVEHRGSALS